MAERQWKVLGDLLSDLSEEMRGNSERWFPQWHDGSMPFPPVVGYTMGLGGEAGEVLNEVKKFFRDDNEHQEVERIRKIGAEIADTLTYLLLVADCFGIDVIEAYKAKVIEIEERMKQ